MNIDELGLYYVDQPERMREVAAFVLLNGKPVFHSRGTAREAAIAIRNPMPGRIGGVGTLPREDVRLCLDTPLHDRDSVNLNWHAETISVNEFLAWYDKAKG